ncbi:MAG: tetratricopeptide repeat protein, partial [Cyclobacteriaceae bacterium]
AKNLYFSQKYEVAVKALTDYLRSYPESASSYEARYYLAEAYYRSNQFDKALPVYRELAANNSGEYYNRVIQRIADIEIGNENFVAAIDNYRKLANVAQNKKEQYFAWSGLMEAYFSQSVYDSAAYFATQILEKASVSANATNQANLFLGKAAYRQQDFDQAIDQFIRTLNTAKDVNGAEAQYLMAEIFYKQGNYNQSLETLFNLNSNFGAYEEWINKSFLLIADNYIAMEEYFQAKATLKSIVEKSPLPQVRDEARKRLNEIEAEEKASIQQDTSFMQPLNE